MPTIDLPEPWFTCDTGYIGYKIKYLEDPECLGKRVTEWMKGINLSQIYSRRNPWLQHFMSSVFLERLDAKFSTDINTADSKGLKGTDKLTCQFPFDRYMGGSIVFGRAF